MSVIEEKNKMRLQELLNETVGKELYQIILSNSRDKEKLAKVKVRPVLLKGMLYFQETQYKGTQVFHNNFDKEKLTDRILYYLEEEFRQCEIEAVNRRVSILISKKGKMTIKNKYTEPASRGIDLSHNRVKAYILEEGKPVPFLIDLGVQTSDGKIIKAKYDKFKQINRFLEFIEDILSTLPKDRTVNIIDFGCGKSYLTFAVYYYLKVLRGLDVKITGLDLKREVIRHCNELAVKYGYDGLSFLHGDISAYEEQGTEKIDMVMTLHACDTATDYALAKAIGWNAKVILAVPCCQHEVNGQIQSEELQPVLKYGLLKERASALITDAIRANIMEEYGYEVQVMEFIDMEHTPKNLLLRGIKKRNKKQASSVEAMTGLLHIETTLQKLMKQTQ